MSHSGWLLHIFNMHLHSMRVPVIIHLLGKVNSALSFKTTIVATEKSNRIMDSERPVLMDQKVSSGGFSNLDPYFHTRVN